MFSIACQAVSSRCTSGIFFSILRDQVTLHNSVITAKCQATACLNFPFLLVLWKMQQVPPRWHHCSPAHVKGELSGEQNLKERKREKQPHFRGNNSRDSGFSTERSCQPNWGSGSSRDDTLGQFSLRGGHWDGSPACQLLRERGRTGGCWSVKSKTPEVHSHLGHRKSG